MKRLTDRLTYANVTATIAVFIALGGSAYAASKINGKTIKVKSIPGNRLKLNTVTGAQINESTLGQVPSAAQANTATTATSAVNATTVNGHTAECKTGTQPFAGSCWESAPRPAATQPAAAAACTGLGGTLPSASDLVAFSKIATLSAGDEWTGKSMA
ncbi:MAG TPA: hypothetical protein VND98_07690 [Solirubrobacterales bacterium]|nr:hypothetical protein [Solirubrobacterales bacterium]